MSARLCPVLAWRLLAVALVGLVGARATAAQPRLEVAHRARSVQPGEVVVIEVASPGAVAVRGSAFGSTIRFYQGEDVWIGLVGLDLDVEPGEHEVDIRASFTGSPPVRVTYPLTVEPKEFPTRRLTVAPRFVNPPPDVLERIEREAARQQEIFTSASEQRLWRGGFLRPVPGTSTSSFGRRSVFNGEARSPHSGADFRSAEGTPIAAPSSGTVVLTGDLYFSGNVVIIDHGWGLYSYFAHLSEIGVAEGESVEQGQVVGKVGATGRVTGPHLHWTVRLNNARVDPIALMELFPAD